MVNAEDMASDNKNVQLFILGEKITTTQEILLQTSFGI